LGFMRHKCREFYICEYEKSRYKYLICKLLGVYLFFGTFLAHNVLGIKN
jgi:hypothetical protein